MRGTWKYIILSLVVVAQIVSAQPGNVSSIVQSSLAKGWKDLTLNNGKPAVQYCLDALALYATKPADRVAGLAAARNCKPTDGENGDFYVFADKSRKMADLLATASDKEPKSADDITTLFSAVDKMIDEVFKKHLGELNSNVNEKCDKNPLLALANLLKLVDGGKLDKYLSNNAMAADAKQSCTNMEAVRQCYSINRLRLFSLIKARMQ